MLITLFLIFGGVFQAALVGQASCLSFLDRQARCLSHQHGDLDPSLIFSMLGIRHSDYELDH
jgi:hypothetical protein